MNPLAGGPRRAPKRTKNSPPPRNWKPVSWYHRPVFCMTVLLWSLLMVLVVIPAGLPHLASLGRLLLGLASAPLPSWQRLPVVLVSVGLLGIAVTMQLDGRKPREETTVIDLDAECEELWGPKSEPSPQPPLVGSPLNPEHTNPQSGAIDLLNEYRRTASPAVIGPPVADHHVKDGGEGFIECSCGCWKYPIKKNLESAGAVFRMHLQEVRERELRFL